MILRGPVAKSTPPLTPICTGDRRARGEALFCQPEGGNPDIVINYTPATFLESLIYEGGLVTVTAKVISEEEFPIPRVEHQYVLHTLIPFSRNK